MPLAWNEIRHRAIKFANDWAKAASESADKQTFWNEFFEVFGVARKTVASFEAPVKKVSGHDGFIDLFWKGVLLVEHKSAGGNKIYLIASPRLFHFGILSAAMHMAWVRQIAGRLESRFQYSGSMVYNNYPWPVDASSAQKEAVEQSARSVLDARKEFPDSTLAQLYDPLKMPLSLRKAHTALDRAVDRCYRKEPFPSDRARVEFLFQPYEQITAPLPPVAKAKRARRAAG